MVISSQAEEAVYKYILDKTKGTAAEINIRELTTEAIIQNVKHDNNRIKKEYIEEAIQKLSGESDGFSGKHPRIERLSLNYNIWIPIDANKIKHDLFEREEAKYGVAFTTFFISLAVGSIWAYFIRADPNAPYLISVYILANLAFMIFIPIAHKINAKAYKVNHRIQKIPRIKYYVFGIILGVSVLILAVLNWEKYPNLAIVGSILGGLASLVTIVGFFIDKTKTQ